MMCQPVGDQPGDLGLGFPNGPTSTSTFWWSSSHGRPVETGEADPNLAAVPAVVR
ncbi:MAG TPA: hypothetical protein VGS97_06985 [Actinocrinis sp.]|uniref:hypothetical protein n=1 Tax=Actinocrinis sp. TaxID=1920516 RepID=UPI002DDD43CA|nr:hypothetical protein [Actinocrinis sp.]HEV2343818.1 hypothetical protein [Actinocrinis sp.]